MLRTTMLTTAVTAIAAGLLLTACGAPDTTGRPAPAPAAPAAADDRAGHTRQVFNITWDQQTEEQRDTLCTSLIILGPEQSAIEMANGAADSPEIDWTLMTELLTTECNNR